MSLEEDIGYIKGKLDGFDGRFQGIEDRLTQINDCVRENDRKVARLEEFRSTTKTKTIISGGLSGGSLVAIIEFFKYIFSGK